MLHHLRRAPASLRRLPLPLRCDRAATSAEYALLIGLIAVVLVIGVSFFGRAVISLFETYPELISS
jgi:Flp pilus assembly pilin Flp